MAQNLYACAVCFGATEISVLVGLKMAILTLLGILLSVFVGLVTFFIQMQRRTRKTVQIGEVLR